MVDDEPVVCRVTERMLAEAGFVVTAFRSPYEALALLAGLRPDLMIADVRMPGMAGTSLARSAQQLQPELPILLTSGYPAPRENGTGELLSHLFLAKPYAQERLLEAVRSLLPIALPQT